MPDTVIRVKWQGGYHSSDYIANHPNEGRVDFPPSPYRLFRALLYVLHVKSPDVPREHLTEIVRVLSQAVLTYAVPNFSKTQLGSFVPFEKGSKQFTALLMDKFYLFDGPLEFHWDVELPEHLQCSLTTLLERLFYLGRSESILEFACLVPEGMPVNMKPWDGVQEGELYPVTFPTMLPAKSIKELLEAQGETRDQYGLLEMMEIHPRTFNRKRIDPPVRSVPYVHVKDQPVRVRRRIVSRNTHEAAVFQVRSRVYLRDFVPFANRIHNQLANLSNGHPTLTGACQGAARKDGSQHAKILPVADETQRVTRVLITSPGGFDDTLQDYLRQLAGYLWRDGEQELVFECFCSCQEFQSSLTGKSDIWTSLTPFHPTTYPKRKRDEQGIVIGSAEYDLRRLIRFAGLPDPIAIIPFSQAENTPWSQYQVLRSEQDQGKRGPDTRTGYRIRFAEPVEGPLSFGFNAHYGLGLFGRET